MPAVKPPTGQKIVEELAAEMEARLYPIVYRTIPPPEYHVYLSAADYAELEPLVPLIVADAQRRLNERVDQLNKRSRWVPGTTRPPIEAPASGWMIFFHPDANEQLGPGELGLVSRLALPAPPRYDGTPTVRIGRAVVSGGTRTDLGSTMAADQAPPPVPATATAAPTERTETLPRPSAFATLTYHDDNGDHVFTIRKDVTTIGRGGTAHAVDVHVSASARVSREHCRIVRRPDGAFVLEDLSTWGTSVDGISVVRGERELPAKAEIRLADTVTMAFAAAGAVESGR